MSFFETVNPEALGQPSGWTNGLLAPAGGRVLFVAGQTARDGSGRIVAGDVAAQWERALGNVLEVVRAAGGGPENIGRLTIYVTDMQAYLDSRPVLGRMWKRVMAGHYPAMALVGVAALADEGAVVEIEATAVL